MKIIRFTLTVIILLLATPSYAADTTTDLLNLYGKTQQKSILEAQAEYNKALQEYAHSKALVVNAQVYNDAVRYAEEYQAEQKNKINGEVQALISANAQISNEIGEAIMGDINELQRLDALYKSNIDKANDLLKQLDKFRLMGEVAVPTVDLSSTQAEVARTKVSLDNARPSSELGDVFNAKHPLANKYAVTSPYGSRVHPVTGKSSQFHHALDLKAAENTKVLSAFNGKVLEAGTDWGLGNFVRVDHGDGIVSIYGHMNSVSVVTGQDVKQYDVIGLSGNTGALTTGPHLHFGLYINSNSVDPEKLYDQPGD